MDFAALSKNIAEKFPRPSPRLQPAARHVPGRADDVALMSMRRLATSAGVHPSTMVRAAPNTIEQSGRQLGIFDAYWQRTRKIGASPPGRE